MDGDHSDVLSAASVHASLASLVFEKRSELEGKRILASSFGSGLAASIFCIRGHQVEGNFSLENIASQVWRHGSLSRQRAVSGIYNQRFACTGQQAF